MAKITLPTISSGYATNTQLNEAFDAIEAEFQNKVLYRNNTSGEANQMENSFDMNSNRILNLPEPLNGNEAARLTDVNNALAGGAANLITATSYSHIAATTVQGFLQELTDEKTAVADLASTASGKGASLSGYLPAGTGAVGSTVQTKLRESVSVADKGADATGVGSSTTAFQNAVSESHVVHVGPGTYTVGALTFTHKVMWICNNATINGVLCSPITIGKHLPAKRGQIFIANNDSPNVAGETLGLYIHIGNNPTATPGTGDSTAATFTINNLNGRTTLWGLNIAALQDASGSDGQVRAAEFEVANATGGAHASTDPFGGATPYRKNGLELVGHSGSLFRLTSALTVWANDTTGGKWWNEGVSLSRCFNYGVHLYKNPGGAADAVLPFQSAAIFDESDSANVLKVNGTHTNIIDLSALTTATRFIKTSSTANQTLAIGNDADFDTAVKLDAGSTAGKNVTLSFADRGTDKWSFIKGTSNAFNVFDNAAGVTAMQFDGNTTNAVLCLLGSALKRLELGAADSGGAGYKAVRVLN